MSVIGDFAEAIVNRITELISEHNEDDDAHNGVFVKNDDSRLSDARTPKTHNHTKNDITDLTIPNASSTTPKADTANGSVGTGTTWAKADHTHPKSTIYASSSHNHTKSEITDFPTTMTPSSHTHTKSEISDFPSTMTPSSHTHGRLQNDGKIKNSSDSYGAGVIISDLGGNLIVADALTNTRLKDANAHSNIGSSANATQGAINTAIDTALGNKANSSHNHTKSEITDFPTLSTVATSGSYDDLTNKPTIPSSITVDSSLSSTSTNPVQNKVINTALSGKASTSTATTSANGLMSSTDKSKLDGIATGANKITVDSSLSSSSTNPVQNKVINTALSGKAASTHSHTKSQITDFPSLSTVATSGSYNDLSDKPNIPNGVTVDTALSSTSTNPLQNKAINSALSGKAPTSHASTSTTYGAASTSNYGHAKLYNGVDSTSTSLAATANAVKTAYDLANGKPSLGTTSTTAAAGNHNHDGVYLKTHQSLDSKTVTVEKQTTAESGYIATYIVKQNGTQVGSKINIPKDFLVKSASVSTCSTTGTPTGFTQGDKYIDFVVNTKDNTGTDEHIYLNVNDLVDAYTAGAGLTLTSGNQFKHSNSVTALTTASFKKIKYDSEGHITGTADVSASDLPTHYHSQYLSSHQDISGKLDKSQGTSNSGKFLKVDSNGNVACESVTIPSAYTHPSTHPASMITGLATVATSGSYNDLSNKPTIPSASSTATDIKMNGTQSAGSASTYAKADHVHPTDTSRVAISQGTTNSGKFLKVNSSGNVACESVTIPSAYTHPSTHPASMITGLSTVATSGSYNDLSNKPTIPSGSSTATDIQMNGTQSAGSASTYAKADHVHPTDTSRVAVNQGTTNNGKFLKVSGGNVVCESVTIPSAYTHPSTHPASMITGLATVATSGSYNDLSNKPTLTYDNGELSWG